MRMIAVALCFFTMTASTAADEVRLDSLKKGDVVRGFRVEAIYLNDSDKPIGARFIHRKSGYVVDYLQIESVPQGYTWVRSITVSEQGEPHTQEHLLLAKGTTGRAFASLDTMWLSGSTAFTQQWRTSYPFNTAAGADVFFSLFARQLEALLHPNYTDEEIRREVRSFGVTENPDSTLRLEERGSVYNEMTSSMARPIAQLFRTGQRLVYGKNHPLAMNSGGEPAGIRTMKPEDIRNFHRSTYYLANMATIMSFPKSVALSDVLRRTDAILGKEANPSDTRKAKSLQDLPKPDKAAEGTISYADYPHRNDQQPSPISFWWPADRSFDTNEQVLANLFFDNIASDPTTNVYKLFIDSKTRKIDIGAKQVFNVVYSEGGNPFAIALTDVAPSNFNDQRLGEVRKIVTDEIERVASFADGSPELKEFNDRISSRLTELQRDLAKFVNTPPGFGFRGGGSQWADHLKDLGKTSDFRKSVTLKPQIAFVRNLLSSNRNFWRDYLTKWKITGVTPYVVATRPSPALLQREESERVARANAEAARLASLYGVTDVQEAIKRYSTEQNAEAAKIEEEAKKIAPPEFVKTPPLTLDDQLSYAVEQVDGVPLVASNFDSMTSAMLGIALRLDAIPREQLRYLSLLPVLLTRVGVIENGQPVSFEEMSERMRKEILSLDSFFSTNTRTGRAELVVRGSGIGAEEGRRAIDWMTLALYHPDWRPENLPRIRDVVDQSLSNLRNTMQGSEESWVNNPADAYRLQQNSAYVAANSFLTRLHNALRLRWLLRDPAPGDAEALTAFFNQLAEAGKGASRADLKKIAGGAAPGLEALSPSARQVANDALKDLDLTLIEIPDSTLAADWAYLCAAIRDDLLIPASTVLDDFDRVRRQLLARNNARMYIVGSTTLQKTLAPAVKSVAARFSAPSSGLKPAATPLVESRLLARDATATKPVYVGLLAPNMRGGVIITSIPGVHYSNASDRDKQLDFLASRLYAGYGAHGIFLKTLANGLAYSNGLRGSVSSGRHGYYAERTPELPQTVRFVVETLKDAPRNPSLGDYAVAQVFGENRAAATYEARAEGIAADLADQQPPQQVREFRQSILELRKNPNLGNELFDRKDRVYAQALPGYSADDSPVPGAVYFVIGPEKQLDLWEAYLKSSEGAETRLFRLYPRDYWMP